MLSSFAINELKISQYENMAFSTVFIDLSSNIISYTMLMLRKFSYKYDFITEDSEGGFSPLYLPLPEHIIRSILFGLVYT